ncbi:uncharacterized protein [Littorina saxatilis]|uniref:uncharacterized protein n=1 Tax=Littorina saxatilis TaxID=31220 RepID=UPI0038B5006D
MGPVSEKEWADIIGLCRKVFPNARVCLSSILPAKGRHTFNNSILPSNRNLEAACRRLDAVFVDNSSSFTASSGAPRLALYSDHIHPSAKGIAKLAINIKYADTPNLKEDRRSSDDAHQAKNHDQDNRDLSRRKQPPHRHSNEDTGALSIPNHHSHSYPPPPPPPPSSHHYPSLIPTRTPVNLPPPFTYPPTQSTRESVGQLAHAVTTPTQPIWQYASSAIAPPIRPCPQIRPTSHQQFAVPPPGHPPVSNCRTCRHSSVQMQFSC